MEESEAGPSGTQQPSGQALISSEESKCIICLVNVDEQELTTLPCSHSFHAECLDKWTQV